MNAILHDLIGNIMEVYINDVVVKSMVVKSHLSNLKQAFNRIRKHGLKMNPLKCAFGVSAGNFLGFLMHKEEIEVEKNKAKAVLKASSPTNLKQLQSLIGKINFLRRFIPNLLAKTKSFAPLWSSRKRRDHLTSGRESFEALYFSFWFNNRWHVSLRRWAR